MMLRVYRQIVVERRWKLDDLYRFHNINVRILGFWYISIRGTPTFTQTQWNQCLIVCIRGSMPSIWGQLFPPRLRNGTNVTQVQQSSQSVSVVPWRQFWDNFSLLKETNPLKEPNPL